MWSHRLVAPYLFERTDVPERSPESLADGQVLLSFLAAGVCGSDIPAFRGTKGRLPGDTGAGAAEMEGFPIHEIVGEVLASRHPEMSTPNMSGRVANTQVMREVTVDLMDVLGAAGALPVGTSGAGDDGGVEFLFRLAAPMGIYGGTLEVFRNMIAQHALGLGRPNYSPTKKVS